MLNRLRSRISLIVGYHEASRCIGMNNQLPWEGKLKGDLRLFQRLTQGSSLEMPIVVMGHKTWESLPTRPLPNRENWVLTHTSEYTDKNTRVFRSWDDLVCATRLETRDIWVIGGGSIYEQAWREPNWVTRYVRTLVRGDLPLCEGNNVTKVPVDMHELSDDWRCMGRTSVVRDGFEWEYWSEEWEREMHEEEQYLDLIRSVIRDGVHKPDRTGTGVLSQVGGFTRWDLRKGFPLLTTKRVFWRGIVEELLWFLRGHTDGKLLASKGVHIWDGNGSREFLDNLGFVGRREGDLGPIYGFQWRNFGGTYMGPDYHEQDGVDQVRDVIEGLRKNPWDRRALVCAWNPTALREMALPPCHVLFQFFGVPTADDIPELHCMFYQRSCDVGLGVPFNIASYALLTHIVAHILGWRVGTLVHAMGDVHIYENHVDALKEQLLRVPREFPKLEIVCEPKNDPGAYQFDDFKIKNYFPYGNLKMKMAV